jgi:hypothetical protein
MSIRNRAPPPTTMQTRFGFIPRPPAPGTQQAQASTHVVRSRSISPTSTVSANSSSSSSLVSQRLKNNQTTTKPPTTRSLTSASTTNNTSKPKTLTSPRPRESSISRLNGKSTLQTPTSASRMRSRTPLRTSAASSSATSPQPPPPPPPPPPSSAPASHTTTTTATKTDVNTIRDRYKTQKRMNFFTSRTPISTANGSPVASSIKSPESLVIKIEKNQQASSTHVKPLPTNHQVKKKTL